jgi:hypothetical protein
MTTRKMRCWGRTVLVLLGQVLKLNGENYTTYDDLLRLHQFFVVGSVEAADPLCAQMIYQDQMG